MDDSKIAAHRTVFKDRLEQAICRACEEVGIPPWIGDAKWCRWIAAMVREITPLCARPSHHKEKRRW
jgi:hypothetical protein